jgi:amino acid transporter
MLSGSRIPYAAAVDGNFFPGLAHLHPKGRFPDRALVLLGGIACLCCFLPLSTLIESMIVIRLVMTFLLQQIGVIVLRFRRPELFRPFRMWLFPVPALFAISGSFFILTTARSGPRWPSPLREPSPTPSAPGEAKTGLFASQPSLQISELSPRP